VGNFGNQALPEEEKGRARADEMEAQRGARPGLGFKLPKGDLKTATARLDQLRAAAGIPSGPPQSPKLRNTDA
jgi:hypothetical protein